MRTWSVRTVLFGVMWLALGVAPGLTALTVAVVTATDVSCPSRPGDVCSSGTEIRTYPEAVLEQAIETVPLLALAAALLAAGIALAAKITVRAVRRGDPTPVRDQRGRRGRLDRMWALWVGLDGAVVAIVLVAACWLATTEYMCHEEVPTGYCQRWETERTTTDRRTAAVLGGVGGGLIVLLSVNVRARRTRPVPGNPS